MFNVNNLKDSTTNGYVIVTSRAMAAAMTFTSKDQYRPVINGVHVHVEDGGTYLDATDAYKLARIWSRVGNYTNPKVDFVIATNELKTMCLITNSPKRDAYLALKPKDLTIEVVAFEYVGKNMTPKVTRTAEVKRIDGSFPRFEQFLEIKHSTTDGDLSPALNTSYLIGILKAAEMAVSYEGDTVTMFRHGNLEEPIIFDSHNDSGERIQSLLMPIRPPKEAANKRRRKAA